MPDVVLTGLPRSGSTLTCHLLNRCADTVALDEPIPVAELGRTHGLEALPEQIAAYYSATRHLLLTARRATSKTVAGQVPDNTFGEGRGGGENLRQSLATRQEVSFAGKELTPNFTLIIKHNTAFAALLEGLMDRFPCWGVVRHPLAMLSSWNSVEMPVQQGFLPVGQMLCPTLDAALQRIADRTERQLYILEWFFERLVTVLGSERIVRYEEIIATGGRALELVTPGAGALGEELSSKNKNAAYDARLTLELGQRLLGREGAFWQFYTRESVEEMLTLLRRGNGEG